MQINRKKSKFERLLNGHEIFCSDMAEKNFREKEKEKGTKTKRGSLNISLANQPASTPIKPAEKKSRIESSDKAAAMQEEDSKKHALFNPQQPPSHQAAIGINSHIYGPMSYYRHPPAPKYEGSREMMGEAMQFSSMQSILSTLDMINLKLSKLDKLDTLEVEVKEVKATLHNANESINGLKAENVALKMQVKSLEESLNTSKKDFAAMKEI